MYSLKNVGPMTENLFGPGRFLATYMVAGASGNLLSAMKRCVPRLCLAPQCNPKSSYSKSHNSAFFLTCVTNSPNPALGASGAVFGVMASFYVFLARNDWVMGQMGEAYSSAITQTLLINLVMGAVNPMV